MTLLKFRLSVVGEKVVYLGTPTFLILWRTTHFLAATLPQIDSIMLDVILKLPAIHFDPFSELNSTQHFKSNRNTIFPT